MKPATPTDGIRAPVTARPWRLRRGVELAPGGAALDAGAAPPGFDAHAAHRREVDDERAVVDGEAVGAVAAAAHA